ncbi:uncharacterized protein [Antedon mediterranea]|uniref:uncharacterized protein isoform X1 n=1 Tax=Antedon mediterranea TaxID=105859 RepID=UPI003AF6E499
MANDSHDILAEEEFDEPFADQDHYEDILEDPDDLPSLPPPMPPPVSSSPDLKEPIVVDLNDNETSNFFPKTPLISESPLKSITKTLSFLPSFLRPGSDSPPPPNESPQDVELQLESNGFENENPSELTDDNDLNYYEDKIEPYPEDNGYEPEYLPDTPEPEVDHLEVNPEAFTRSKSVTFADDVENLEEKNSTPLFSIFGSIHRRLSDTLKPLLSPKEETISEPFERDESDAPEDDQWQNQQYILNEEEIEIHETDIDSNEVPISLTPELEEIPPEPDAPHVEIEDHLSEKEELPHELEEFPLELEEQLDFETNNLVELENNQEALDIDSSYVETLGEPLENVDNFNTDDIGVIEQPEADEQPASLKDSIPFSLGAFSSFRMPGSNDANKNNVDEVIEGQEPNENSSFSFGGFSKLKMPVLSSSTEANGNQESPASANSSFSFGGFSNFRMPGSNDISTSDPNDGQEPPVENSSFSFGISGFRDLVPIIPLPAFPNSEFVEEDVEVETERVTDGSEEPISIPEVSIQEVQNLDIDTNGSLLATSGLLSSDRFGQDEENEAENKEILDKEDGEAVEAREEDTLEHQRIDLVGSEEVQVDPLNQSLENDNLNKTDINISVTAPEDVPEIPPPLETEIPAEITAETPPPFNTAVESPKTEEKGFKKQTSSGDVPKRYVKSDLSKGSSSSLTSLYSASGEAYGKIPITGDVQFGLSYNHKLTQFSINVVACRDLAPVDTKKNKSDPYVKVYLLPDKGRNGKRKSKIKKGTINPQFNELLRYKIKETELRTRTLSVAVWNNDKLGRNFFLGEVLLPLDDIHFDNYNPKWHQLLPKVLDDGGIIYKGDITLALKFEGEGVEADQKAPKSTGALLIHFKSAKNLTAVRPNGSDPYAKCYLEPDRSKAGKRKTKHVRSSCNPNWDQQVQYDNVTIDQLKERALYVTVWDKDTLSANDFLGVISLSLGTGRVGGKDVTYMKSKGEAIRIWEEMLTKPNSWVEATIPLQAKL